MPRKKNFNTVDGFNKVFPTRFREEAREKKISQGKIAKELGISRQAVSYYMNGISLPDIECLERISRILDVSADYLLGLSDFKSLDVDIVQAAKTTGLSEDAIKALKQYANDDSHIVNSPLSFVQTSKAPKALNIILGEAWAIMKDQPDVRIDWGSSKVQEAPRSHYGVTILDRIADYITFGNESITYVPSHIFGDYIKKYFRMDINSQNMTETEKEYLLNEVQISISNSNVAFKPIDAKRIHEAIVFEDLIDELKALRERVIEQNNIV